MSLNLTERIKFEITFARFYFGSGPIDSQFKPIDEAKEETEEEGVTIGKGEPFIYLEIKTYNRKLLKILGKGLASARLYRHTTGRHKTSEGRLISGQLNIGNLPDEEENFVEVVGLLEAHAFDTIVSSVIEGGKELLSKSAFTIGLKDDLEEILISELYSTTLLEDLCFSFEVGEKYDELLESD